MKALRDFKTQKVSFINNILVIIAFLITSLSIATGSYVQDYDNLSVGMVSPKRYVAPRDIEDTSATNKLKEDAIKSVGPLYKHDDEVQDATIDEINELFDSLNEALRKAESNGSEYADIGKDLVLKIPVALTSRHYVSYGALSSKDKAEYKEDLINIAVSVYDQGITKESKDSSMEIVSDKLRDSRWSETLKVAGYQILSVAMKPNLVLDEQAMAAAIEQKINEVEPVMIIKNQKIVDEGEVITKEILSRLESLNLVNQDYSDSLMPIVGSILIVILLFGAVYIYFMTLGRRLMVKPNEMIVLFICYMIAIISIRLTSNFTEFYFIPLYIFAMLVSVLISTKLALIFSCFICVISLFIFNGRADFLIFFLVSSVFGALVMQFSEKRKQILAVAAAIGAVNFVTYVSTGLFFETGELVILLTKGLYSAVTGILSVILVVGSMPLWEAIFEINTPFKLLELANPNNELLRRLMIEAPGTYHHSLIVANLAEAAAYEIGANASVVRVGAYYHDIGKLSYPLYFSENQAGENVHDSMLPSNSARIIIQHVNLGLELADKYNLPKLVKDIIVQHHGTTLVKYFYHKAVTMYSKENVNEEDFRYPGPKPDTKEAAIIMLADTVEAAVRSSISGGKDINEVESLIDILVKDKLDAGQFDNCNITLKDITIIKSSFVKVFKGMYHDRIAYPKDDESKTDTNKQEEI